MRVSINNFLPEEITSTVITLWALYESVVCSPWAFLGLGSELENGLCSASSFLSTYKYEEYRDAAFSKNNQ